MSVQPVKATYSTKPEVITVTTGEFCIITRMTYTACDNVLLHYSVCSGSAEN